MGEEGGAAGSGIRAGPAEPRSLGPGQAVEVNPVGAVEGGEVHLGPLCFSFIFHSARPLGQAESWYLCVYRVSRYSWYPLISLCARMEKN